MTLGSGSEFHTAPYGAEGFWGVVLGFRCASSGAILAPRLPGGARGSWSPTLDAVNLRQGWVLGLVLESS